MTYKIVEEIIIEVEMGRERVVKRAYICDPSKYTECKKTNCGHGKCYLTTDIKNARWFDVFDEIIIKSKEEKHGT